MTRVESSGAKVRQRLRYGYEGQAGTKRGEEPCTAAEWHVGVDCIDPFIYRAHAMRPYKLPRGLAAAVLGEAALMYEIW